MNRPDYCRGTVTFKCPYCERSGSRPYQLKKNESKCPSLYRELFECTHCGNPVAVFIPLPVVEVEVHKVGGY